MDNRLLNVSDTATYLGIHRSTLDHWRLQNPPRGPAFTRVGYQIRYRQSDLDGYLDKHLVMAE